MEHGEISVRSASDAIDMIGREWMLIGAADAEHGEGAASAMTASWGAFGELWGYPVCICFIRPQRYTLGLAEKSDRLSFSFFGTEKRDALRFCGKESGRDGGKLEKAGLHYSMIDGVPVFDDARLTVIGRKLYECDINSDGFIEREIIAKHYPDKDFHRFFVCAVERCLK